MAGVFLVLGGSFIAISALGVLRMPEFYARMHSNTKAGTLGLGLILLAVAIHFGTLGISARALAMMAFLALTAPVAAHVIGRAAYHRGVPLWKDTVIDELGRWREHCIDQENP